MLIRVADIFFTSILLMIVAPGIVLAWALGILDQLSAALLVVAILAPGVHRVLR